MTYSAEEQANLDLVAGLFREVLNPDGFARGRSLHRAGLYPAQPDGAAGARCAEKPFST